MDMYEVQLFKEYVPTYRIDMCFALWVGLLLYPEIFYNITQ